MPDVPSVPENVTVSAWLYQPFASATRLAAGAAVGGDLSILNVLLFVNVPLMSEAVHVSVVPVVSVVSGLPSHPLEFSARVTTQFTVTLLVYQLFVPSVPMITMSMVTSAGAPAARGTGKRPTAAKARRASV